MSESDNYSIAEFGRMINDPARTRPWVEALRQAVQPDSVVLDIGTGTGFFAFLACQFGAARVYAVEPDVAIEVAKLCAANNAGSDRISWLRALSTDIELPERVDVVIGDLHGNMPFYPGNITSLIDARQRHLKPGGRMIPARDVLYAAPAHAPDSYCNVDSPWSQNDYGIDFEAGRVFASNSVLRVKTAAVAPENLLAPPGIWGVVDYSSVDSPSLDGRVEWTMERHGTLHGMYVWFDGEPADNQRYSNAPTLPGLPYGRIFLPLERAVEVIPGDRMSAFLSATLVDRDYVYRWDTRITSASDEVKGEYKQSNFKDSPLGLSELRRAAAEFVPTLGLAGKIDHFVIQALAECQPLGSIAAKLVDRYPQRFQNEAAALGHVARLSVKYTE